MKNKTITLNTDNTNTMTYKRGIRSIGTAITVIRSDQRVFSRAKQAKDDAHYMVETVSYALADYNPKLIPKLSRKEDRDGTLLITNLTDHEIDDGDAIVRIAVIHWADDENRRLTLYSQTRTNGPITETFDGTQALEAILEKEYNEKDFGYLQRNLVNKTGIYIQSLHPDIMKRHKIVPLINHVISKIDTTEPEPKARDTFMDSRNELTQQDQKPKDNQSSGITNKPSPQ